MRARFHVLGPLRAWHGDTEIVIGPPKRSSLLAFLLLQPGHPVPVHEMVDALWRGAPPDSAVNVVHRHLGALRRLLEPERPGKQASRCLVRGPAGYVVDAEPETLDLLRFRQLRNGATAGTDPEDRFASLLRALALWRGPVASGVPPEVRTHPLFGSLDAEHLAAVKEASDIALRGGRSLGLRLLGILGDVAGRHALDEALQARLVTLLAVTGHRAEALDVYRGVRDRLADDLGVRPGAELRTAYQGVLAGTGARAAASVPRVRPGPVGAARAAPAPEVPHGRSGPATRSADPVRPYGRSARLPPPEPSFLGRREELARLRDLVRDDLSVAVVAGMPGVGKTALAVRLCHEIADRFPDGQLHADLGGFGPGGNTTGPHEAVLSFLLALGVPAHRVPAGLDARVLLYRSLLARRRVLILLDNARDSDQIRPLVPGSSGSLVVVTSRHRLSGLVASEGARSVTLDVLGDADALRFLRHRLGPEQVGADPEDLARIVAACGGLPLALSSAARRVRTDPAMPPSALAAALRRGRVRPEPSPDGAPGADVRTSFSWSYRLLDPAAAHMFRLLSLSSGEDIPLAAAASLAGREPGAVRSLLRELSRRHLVTETVPGRYGCHPLLRAYAREVGQALDTPAERDAATRRMFDHYLHGAHAAALVLAPCRESTAPGPPLPGTTVPRLADAAAAAAWLSTDAPALLAAALAPWRDHDAGTWGLAAAALVRSGDCLHAVGHTARALHVRRRALGILRHLDHPDADALHRRIGGEHPASAFSGAGRRQG